MKRFWYLEQSSPVGRLLIAGDEDGALVALDYEDYPERMKTLLNSRFGASQLQSAADPVGIVDRLERYFEEGVDTFGEVPVNLTGSPLQVQVWQALRGIPSGETRSYGQLATSLGKPKAARAVGHANSLNPVGIVVPCHRVIGSNGKLTGYAGGLARKEWLLRHERQHHLRYIIPIPETISV
jgi:O-6-methylguanine DNA methyltransferase